MLEHEDRLSYIFILLFSLFFIVIYIVYMTLVIKYIIVKFSKKRLSIYWLQYIITCIIAVLLIFIYLFYLMQTKGERINLFLDNGNPFLLISTTIFLIANIYSIINNLIFDSIASILLSINLYKINNISSNDLQELCIKIKNIKLNIFNSKQHIFYWLIFGVIDIALIIFFEIEYMNYENFDPDKFLQLKNIIFYLLKMSHLICFSIFFICLLIMNFLKYKFFSKKYFNTDKFAMKVYEINSCEIIYKSDIISFKLILDLLINAIIFVFLICDICNGFFMILSEIVLFLYILILGALYFKMDKNNDIGKINKNIKYWFCLKKIHFSFGLSDHKTIINENTYKYSKEEKEILKQLKLEEYDLILDEKIGDENKNRIDDSKLEINEEKENKKDNSKSKQSNKILNFETNSELYVLYKLLMLYFEKNEAIYLNVQNKILDEGTPFKQFFVDQQNVSKYKKVKSRQTFGGADALFKKDKFISNIDRVSRISKLNSTSIIPSMKFKENKIFFSLEEKELKEEFKKKFNFPEKETTFKIESLSSNTFFELFPFYQISVQDIKRALNPSDNKKIYNIIRKRNSENLKKISLNKDNIESISENNLFYTYNSLLMMEIYEPEEFLSFEDLQKFTISYGAYLLETIKNINFTFIPLILGVFSIEICGENKVVILYRNPLYFSNFNKFNHWISFFITEGPEKPKPSILSEVLDVNEIEIKNSLKMNEADYEEIINNLKNDFKFFRDFSVYPIINLFIGDKSNAADFGNNNDANESSMGGDISLQQNNLSGLLNNLELDVNNINTNINLKKDEEEDLYGTETNSLVEKEYYSMTGNDLHTIKIYFTHFFRLDCELNKQNNNIDNMNLASYNYCQFLEGQLQTYLTKTTLFELDNEN